MTFFLSASLCLLLSVSQPVGDYTVGPGDILKIEVWGEDDLSGSFTVSPRGTIKNIMLGEVEVKGLTPSAIEQRLVSLLKKDYMKEPRVKVLIEEYHSQKTFVLGEVAKPGPYILRGSRRLLDVLLDAGGPTSLSGDKVSILRKTGEEDGAGSEKLEQLSVNIQKLFLEGDLSQNIPIKSDDIIYVSRMERGDFTTRFFEKKLNVFYVVGAVKSPGAFEMKEGYTILNAILSAGGLSEQASPNSTKLVRGEGENKQVLTVKMGDVMEKGKKEKDIPLQAGDLIIVPESWF